MISAAVDSLKCSHADGWMPHSGQATNPIRAIKWWQKNMDRVAAGEVAGGARVIVVEVCSEGNL